jgi:4-alpha-glucanotransferase
MQDLLGLGTEARMNFPSTLGGNWIWRLSADELSQELQGRLRELNYLYLR